VEATPVAEAVPADSSSSAAAAGGGYVPPTYADGTYARPPPVSPYASAIAEPTTASSYVSSESSYQQGQGQQQQQHGGRAPQPLEPYPLPGQPQPPHRHQQGQGQQAVMGQAVAPVQVQQTGGQPMTGEQVSQSHSLTNTGADDDEPPVCLAWPTERDACV